MYYILTVTIYKYWYMCDNHTPTDYLIVTVFCLCKGLVPHIAKLKALEHTCIEQTNIFLMVNNFCSV